MKIIDLLNKIANDERFDNCKMKFKGIEPEMVDECVIYDKLYEEKLTLNDEVEIIEENKKIEKIELYEDSEGHYFYDKHCKKIYITCDETNFMFEQFNDLIDEVNKLKEV